MNYNNIKNKELPLDRIIKFVRQKHVDYEIDGSMYLGFNNMIMCKVQQKGITNGNRKLIPRPTECEINFHTHPEYDIWPSIEDINNIRNNSQLRKPIVIVTMFGCWVLYKKSHFNERNYYRFVNSYNKFAEKMFSFYYFIHTHFYINNKPINKAPTEEIDPGLLQTFKEFTKDMEQFDLSIKFYVMDKNMNNSNRFRTTLLNLLRRC